MSTSRLLLISLLLLFQPLHAGATDRPWINAAAIAFGESDDSDESDVYRISFQKKWRHSWFDGGAWFLGGYWDTGLTRIKADSGHTGTVYDIN
ncbi:MAG: hypothetical protein WBO37_01060, partial [Gammaproteobacteria bacterium]